MEFYRRRGMQMPLAPVGELRNERVLRGWQFWRLPVR
jgi:hypothetical protein